jgi:peptidoglycan/xylan/chitin deacetylase (PgdA/CDA1 family)
MQPIIYILTFHGLGSPERRLPDGEDRYWLAPGFFESILDRVMGRPDVFITFDDSNSSDFLIALPALVRRQMRASFFVVSERMGLPGFLSPEQVRELAGAGMTIGSHGTQHRLWPRLGAGELDQELKASRRSLEEVAGRTVDQAACPYGGYNRRVLRAARAAGYGKIHTSDQGTARPGWWFQPRNTITRDRDLGFVETLIESKRQGLPSLIRRLKLLIKRLR